MLAYDVRYLMWSRRWLFADGGASEKTMKVMVIDTALGACLSGVFEVSSSGVSDLGVRREEMTKGHQERLGGMARDAVKDAGGFEGLERVGVTVGPGSFTGLRVGLSFALGLGAARNVPVVGISTLDALVASVEPQGLVAAAIDARRGQVYIRLFRDGVPLDEAQALEIEAARDLIVAQAQGGDLAIVGSGVGVLTEGYEALSDAKLYPLVAPSPQAMAQLTQSLDPTLNPPSPLYLRAPDATPPSRLPGQPRITPAP